MVKITFRDVWAGWKDATLTTHGVKQAEALALSFATTSFTDIYTSDLKRAFMTAQAIHAAQRPSTKLHTTKLLREQYFGAAEGTSYKHKRDKDLTLRQHFSRGIYPPVFSRHERFPGGESKDDVSERAREFMDTVILPLVQQEAEGQVKSVHIAVVSHGLFIPELVVLLWKKHKNPVSTEFELRQNLRGMRNTAWTRIEFGFDGDSAGDTVSRPCKLKFLHVNCHNHLDSLTRQKGGISRLAYDPAQKDIRSFFSKNKSSS
ncbi:hypothetical protein CC1G_07149 [Coprinopsis cinerea okayama7|uniref:Phosphoglycerate mutase n=1 Tax=Coprinopsis cinerea (strain Okayama-7 / 130 / ATCC MYA-4618 / FGSC 9003) TaxID=240176 RepID=A8NR89_COPC7|nr:hypothetical protein CC1G_07149 [Coprinopsis cinerea okayama7\|eukprot:XP_001835725.1 hypothetical protein CC1G_07149 [Coprinopsis cinerea okayama7\